LSLRAGVTRLFERSHPNPIIIIIIIVVVVVNIIIIIINLNNNNNNNNNNDDDIIIIINNDDDNNNNNNNNNNNLDFRLPPRCWKDLRSSGLLRGVVWSLFTDVSGQRIGPIFKVNNYHTAPCNIPEERGSHRQHYF
jgi:hypothetical protein